jgi:molecular chaperone DnaK
MLSDEEQNYVRETLNGAKEVLNVQDIEVVKQWLEALEQAAQTITNAMFNMPAGDTPPPETGGVKMLTE